MDKPSENADILLSNPDAAAIDSMERESGSLWKEHPWLAGITLAVPIWLSTLILALTWVLHGTSLVKRVIVAASASLAAGRFMIWTGTSPNEGLGLTAWQLALLVLYLDLIWAVVLTWHAGFLFHVPWIGVRLKAAVTEGGELLKSNHWMKRLTVTGVLLFVMLPVSSTGSIGGSLLGRLLGLTRTATFATVFAGSVLGCGVMLAGAGVLATWFQQLGPWGTYGSIALLVVIGYVISRRYRRSLTD